jgi:hypothetical protein
VLDSLARHPPLQKQFVVVASSTELMVTSSNVYSAFHCHAPNNSAGGHSSKASSSEMAQLH